MAPGPILNPPSGMSVRGSVSPDGVRATCDRRAAGDWGSMATLGRMGWKRGLLLCALALPAGARGAASAQPPTAPAGPMTAEEFQRHATAIRSTSAVERRAAVVALGQRGRPFRRDATPMLREALRADTDGPVRAEAARAIGRLGLRDALPELITALADPESSVRLTAAVALWRLPDPSAVPALITALADSDPQVRAHCALAVGVTEDPRAAEPLSRLLEDEDPNVRLEAVRSLGRIAEPASMAPLARVAANAHEELETRLEAVNALAALRSPDKANELVRLLEVDDLEVRTQVIRALGQIGDALVIPPLRRALTRPGAGRLATEIRAAIAAIEARAASPESP